MTAKYTVSEKPIPRSKIPAYAGICTSFTIITARASASGVYRSFCLSRSSTAISAISHSSAIYSSAEKISHGKAAGKYPLIRT